VPRVWEHAAVVPDADALGPDAKLFLERTNDDRVGLVVDLAPDSDTLLVAFGGLAGHIGMPPFEFFRVSGQLGVKRAFVRDTARAWYHHGVAGVGGSIDEVARKLGRLLVTIDASRSVFVGASAGGYAAMLFGRLLQPDEVLAFSPQSLIDVARLEAAGDTRYSRWLRRADRTRGLDGRWIDLAARLAEDPVPPGTTMQVHYCDRFALDAFHAERFGGIPGVSLHAHMHGKHGLIRSLRDSGELTDLLMGATRAERSRP
jgi:hypothetical protein